MKIALAHFRMGETDGVSLEMEKWKMALERLGHQVFRLAGSLSGLKGEVIEALHYQHQENETYLKNAYDQLIDYPDEFAFKKALNESADDLEKQLSVYLRENQIDLIIPNNIFSLGWNLPAALAFSSAIEKSKVHCLAHHHDFYWERDRYSHPTCGLVSELLKDYFPPKHPLIKHVVINSIAQGELLARKQIDSSIVPNVFDFDAPLWKVDHYNRDFRESIGLKENDVMVLQATRIDPRKAIELAIDMVAALNKQKNSLLNRAMYNGQVFNKSSRIVLVLAGLPEGQEEYIHKLKNHADKKNVELLFINECIGHERQTVQGRKIYSLWDAYVHADLVTYPSILEGWGNQFLEAVFAKKPILLFEYPVYQSDIAPYDFDVVSLGSDFVRDPQELVHVMQDKIAIAADQLLAYLLDNVARQNTVDKNFKIAQKYFSYKALVRLLTSLV